MLTAFHPMPRTQSIHQHTHIFIMPPPAQLINFSGWKPRGQTLGSAQGVQSPRAKSAGDGWPGDTQPNLTHCHPSAFSQRQAESEAHRKEKKKKKKELLQWMPQRKRINSTARNKQEQVWPVHLDASTIWYLTVLLLLLLLSCSCRKQLAPARWLHRYSAIHLP